MPARRNRVTSGDDAQGTQGNDDQPSQGRVLRARTAKVSRYLLEDTELFSFLLVSPSLAPDISSSSNYSLLHFASSASPSPGRPSAASSVKLRFLLWCWGICRTNHPDLAQIMESGGPRVNAPASVQRPSQPKQARSIPLRCYLCPKQPTFSDISHLLTHISSKSHLACRFKLELEKKSDDDAKSKLDTYDQWYNVNEIEDLLDSRMAAKKEKKPPTKIKAAATGVSHQQIMIR